MRRNARITSAEPDEILDIVEREPLNGVNVATAVTRLARRSRPDRFQPRAGDARWATLARRVRDLAPELGAREVANAVHGYAMLDRDERAPRRHVPLHALAGELPRVAACMRPQHVGNALWGFGRLRALGKPSPDAHDALEAAVAREARRFKSQELANTLWGLAMLARKPGAAAADALFAAAAALADDDALDRQACTNVLWSLASLSLAPPERTWAALRRALQRHAPELDRQELCNALWAVRVLAELPGAVPCDAGTLAALGDAVAARGAELDVPGFANCCRLVRAVGWVPGAAALDAVYSAGLRLAPKFAPAAVAAALAGFTRLGAATPAAAAAADAALAALGREARRMRAPELFAALTSLPDLGRDVPAKARAQLDLAVEGERGTFQPETADLALRAYARLDPPPRDSLVRKLAAFCEPAARHDLGLLFPTIAGADFAPDVG